ncbi:PucR family transcriptional regulator [Cellulosimicrobium funkei]|nr:PucR family transcriptional regulator [Cellulosimicrobium funkei]
MHDGRHEISPTHAAVVDIAGITVAEVLELDVLKAGRPEVLAGLHGLERLVRWIHIAEDAETSTLLEGGELVLTTGLNFKGSEAATRKFLDRFLAAGAVGIVIEIADEADAKAANLVREAAASASGVVVLLHHRIRYVQVTEQVHRILMKQQLARVERARHVHEVYTELSLQNASEQQIVDRTAEMVAAPVVFEDVGHRVLSYHPADAVPAELLGKWQERSRRVAYSANTGVFNEDTADSCGSAWLQTPVGHRGQRWGRLVVPAERGDETDAMQVLERAGQALTMARMAGRDRREVLHQAKSGLLHDLRQAPTPTEQEAVARASSLGLEPGASYLPVVVRLDRSAGESATAVQLREREVLEAIERVADSARLPVLAASIHAGSVGLLLSVAARELETPALERIFGDLETTGLSVGVGAGHGSLLDAAAGLEEATHVAEIAATLDTRQHLYYRFTDVRLRGLLSVLSDDVRVRAFAKAELAGLLDPQEGKDLELLEAFLTHGGNKSALARSGYISRQALYPRLARLQEKLGVSLDDAESRTALHVAILWLRQSGR